MDDKEIIKLYFARDQLAIEETMLKYGALCRSLALNILGNDLDAEECENDAYIAMWNSIPPNSPKHLSAYLCRIVRNNALSRLKYINSRKREAVIVSADELAEIIPDTDRPAGEIASAISEFLRQSPETERRVFVKRYFSNETVEKIASDEGFTVSKIKSMLFRIRNKLREYLKKEGITV